MSARVDAVYENGVLRPLQPLDLSEHERVVITVARTVAVPDRSGPALEYVERLRTELRNAGTAPGREEVRRRMGKIRGSMAEEVVASRGNR